MEHEVFEDDEVAGVLNGDFVAIKLPRFTWTVQPERVGGAATVALELRK